MASVGEARSPLGDPDQPTRRRWAGYQQLYIQCTANVIATHWTTSFDLNLLRRCAFGESADHPQYQSRVPRVGQNLDVDQY
jgi:hypothetical protein